MKAFLRRLSARVYRLISSRWFLYVTLGLFCAGALWVALASVYPMAFDEEFHVGIIRLYAHSWLPVIAHPDAGMAQFGAVTHDPSYLYHYLMSFPWRLLVDGFHMSDTSAIIVLRLLNIEMFVAALIVFSRVLGRAGLSRFARNVIVATTCLVPISPLIAGQVNYDNLFMLLTAGVSYFAVSIVQSMRTARAVSFPDLAWLIILCLLGTATKYAFLPIAVAACVGLIIIAWRQKQPQRLWRSLVKSWSKTAPWLRLGLVGLLIIAALLNVRYVANLISYHDISPSCDAVFSKSACMNYGVFARDETYRELVSADFRPLDPVSYVAVHWVNGVVYRLFFTLAGPTNGYDTHNAAYVPIVVYSVAAGLGVILFLVRLRSIARRVRPEFWLAVGVIGLYILAIIFQVYSDYRSTGVAVALNGRYLIPIFPLIGWVMYEAWRGKRPAAQTMAPLIIALALIIVMCTGGGILTYLSGGSPSWFWPGFGQDTFRIMHPIAEWLAPLYPWF